MSSNQHQSKCQSIQRKGRYHYLRENTGDLTKPLESSLGLLVDMWTTSLPHFTSFSPFLTEWIPAPCSSESPHLQPHARLMTIRFSGACQWSAVCSILRSHTTPVWFRSSQYYVSDVRLPCLILNISKVKMAVCVSVCLSVYYMSSIWHSGW